MKTNPTQLFNVNEIFYSIQGEGSRSGLKCIFVRFQGCLLRCSWCDTPYALERKEKHIMMSAEEIFEHIAKYDCKFLMLTGGEPLEQDGIFDFISDAADRGYDVVIETNGNIDTSPVDERAVRIIDIKLPDSKMHKKNNYKNLEIADKKDEVKFVVGSESDFNFAIDIIKKYDLENKVGEILISPVFSTIDPQLLAQLILNSGLKVRMQLQIHKYIWEPSTRGV